MFKIRCLDGTEYITHSARNFAEAMMEFIYETSLATIHIKSIERI